VRIRASRRVLLAIAAFIGLSAIASGCGSESDARIAGVTIEPLSTATVPRASTPPIGGKPATPPAAFATPEAEVAATTDAEPATEIAAATEEFATEAVPTVAPSPLASDGSSAPVSGRWIEVDVTAYVVRLMDGATVVREITPVGVGEQVDTGEYASTQTGLFYVNSKIEELAYDPPYDTYISHWVGFDLDKANGFHSFLKDANATVVDASTGRVSNGCIRTGEAEAVFAYAEIGMPVWVHW